MEPPPIAAFVQTLSPAFAADDPGVSSKQLERANVDVIAQMFEDLGRGDLDALLAGMTNDVELEIRAPAEYPLIRHAKGAQAFREAVTHNFGELTDQRPEVLNVVAQGNCVVLFGRDQGRLRATDAPYAAHFVYEFFFRDGKVCRVRELAAPSGLT